MMMTTVRVGVRGVVDDGCTNGGGGGAC